jgi:diguanylate cyclase (GGDEF)-like protein
VLRVTDDRRASDRDRIKKVNDEYGHAAGDRVIREAAAATERYDPAFTAFRIGGEEFTVLVRGKGEEEAAALAEELRECIAAGLSDAAGKVTVSIGVAEAQPDENQDGLLRRADDALYCAKRNGRNRVCRAARIESTGEVIWSAEAAPPLSTPDRRRLGG